MWGTGGSVPPGAGIEGMKTRRDTEVFITGRLLSKRTSPKRNHCPPAGRFEPKPRRLKRKGVPFHFLKRAWCRPYS